MRLDCNKRLAKIHELALSLVMSMVIATTAYGGGGAQRYDIAPQALDAALTGFADRANLKLLFPAELVKGLKSSGVAGELTAEDALRKLLSGTGMTYRYTSPSTVTIERAPPSTDATSKLKTVTVTDKVASDDPTAYRVSRASTATKTDTPIFDTPVSVQTVASQVMLDQRATNLDQALENVSGVRPEPSMGPFSGFIIRGLSRSADVFRDGLRYGNSDFDMSNLERVEVLKGPAAVLYGRAEPGGMINLVTKKPQDTPYYSLSQEFGSYSRYRTVWDATGPLASNNSLSYRFNGAYQDSGSFHDFHDLKRMQFFPSVLWRPTEQTDVLLNLEIFHENFQGEYGIPVIGRRPARVPVSRSFQDPNDPSDVIERQQLGFELTHRFNETWTFHNRFRASFDSTDNLDVVPAPVFGNALLADDRTLGRNLFYQKAKGERYAANLDLTGKFDTWGLGHEVLAGYDHYNSFSDYHARGDWGNPDATLAIDIFNPSYGIDPARFNHDQLGNLYWWRQKEVWNGIYLQDHLAMLDGTLHLLAGGRYDWATIGSINGTLSASDLKLPKNDNDAFSPRVGLLYQPVPWAGIYGNWTQSFGANNGLTANGKALSPETGEQFETGIKTEFFDKRLSANLAYYHITKDNIMTADLSTPDPFDNRTIGQVRSEGIELDVTGKVSDGLSVVGSYALTDARITVDGNGNQGHHRRGVPEQSGSTWLKYDFQENSGLKGLSMGFGVFAVGKRAGDDENSFDLPAYTRFDAYSAYRWNVGKSSLTAQLNVRNLTDKTHYVSSEPFWNSSPRNSVFAGEPLTVTGTIRLEY